MGKHLEVLVASMSKNTKFTSITSSKGAPGEKEFCLEFLEFTGAEWENFTRYVSTWWLCLEQWCLKELKKFDALKSKSPVKRFSRLRKVYENLMSEVYLQFYANALPLFTTYNKFLQRSK